MRKVLVVGAGGHGRSVAETILLTGEFELVGFLDDAVIGDVWGFPILGSTASLESCRACADSVVVAIGRNSVRRALHEVVGLAGFGIQTVIHPHAAVSRRASLGEGCVIMAGAVVGTEAILGAGVIVNSGASVDHHCCVGDFGHLGVGASMAGGSMLGSGAWMQAGSALGYGVRLGDQEVLGPAEGRAR
jgi:sugar O-acyltransferase (sialic acid O-acetyltransferase NeuD family)